MPASSDDTTHMDRALYWAAMKGEFQVFENYAQPLHGLLDINKNTILHIHLNSSSERLKKTFVEHALGQCPELLRKANNAGDTPLHIAAKHGYLEIVELLIEQSKTGSEGEATQQMLREPNKEAETALHLAIRGNFVGVVKEILKHEDPNYVYIANKSGETPLYLALDMHREDIAEEVINKFESPDCSGPNGRSAFIAAVYECHFSSQGDSLFDLMLDKMGSHVNQADESGWTSLHYAAYLGHSDYVAKILEKDRSSAYATDKERKRTALHMASCRGQLGAMIAIIDECPDCCDITDDKGWNVLHYAVFSNDHEAVKVILRYSSLTYLMYGRDIKEYTPLHLLVASHTSYLSLMSWIRNVKSALPSQILGDQIRSILLSIQFSSRHLNNYDNPDSTKEQILEWMKDIGKGPLGGTISVGKQWKEMKKEREEKIIPELEKAKDSHLVAAALVATVTFAAAFTLPGGYISNEKDLKLKGTPILSRNAAFKAFVITDAIAMVLSTSSVFIHFIMVMLGYKQRYYWLIRSVFWFIVLAMGAMVVAFVTGTYAVLAPSRGIAIATCVIGLGFFVNVFYTSIRLIFDFIKHDKEEHPNSSLVESLLGLLVSAPQYLSCGCDCWRLILRLGRHCRFIKCQICK